MSLSATHSIRGNDNGCLGRKLIKCLTGSADDLSSLLACTHYLYVALWCGPSALWSRSKALKDIQFSIVAGTDRCNTHRSSTVITTVIPLLVFITVDDQALNTFDHSSL